MDAQLNSEPAIFQPHNGFSAGGLKEELDNFQKEKTHSESLKKVLATMERIKKIKETDIKFDEAMLLQGSNMVFYPQTINLIQGQAGVHKSRLAQIICSALLKRPNFEAELLGFSLSINAPEYTVFYVDTERNQSTQFPYALQSIQMNAGYKKNDHPETFLYSSLLEVPRKERFTVLNEHLELLKQNSKNPLFVVLDVSTDCIEDFNKTDKSMELIDLMNVAVNQHDVVFLCLIHENPRTEKARGHFGTELLNKASTVMQVSFEKDAKQQDTNLVKVRYLKCRNNARHESFFVKYSESTNSLVLASDDDISLGKNCKKQKANLNEVTELLEGVLGNGQKVSRANLLKSLREETGASIKTLEERLKEIRLSNMPIYNEGGIECFLASTTERRILYYFLSPLTEQAQIEDLN
jgi:hypothetical protein